MKNITGVLDSADVEAVTRLIDIGVASYQIATAVKRARELALLPYVSDTPERERGGRGDRDRDRDRER